MPSAVTWGRSAAVSRVRDLLEVSVPDGLLDDAHAEKLAAKVVDDTLRALGLGEHHTVRVKYHDRVDPDRMQAADHATARDVAERMEARDDVAWASPYMRWCSPWHRTS